VSWATLLPILVILRLFVFDRPLGQHGSDWSRDLATLTFDLGGHGLCGWCESSSSIRMIWRTMCVSINEPGDPDLWPTCDFRFWGQMTLKVKIFEDVFQDSSTGHWITFRGQIWWKSAVAKLLKCRLDYHTKNGLRRDSSQPHFAKNGPIAHKIPWTLSPLDMSTYTEFGPDLLRFDFSA